MILGVIAINLLFASWVLWIRYAYTKPVSCSAEVGRVYALNTHGSIVYLNDREPVLLCGLQVAGGLSFGVAVLIEVLSNRRKTKQSKGQI